MTKTYQNYFEQQYKYKYSLDYMLMNSRWILPQWRIIKKHIKEADNFSVLEIGSGIGGIAKKFADEFSKSRYIGIDLDAKVVDFCQKELPKLEFVNTSIENFNPTRKFNTIICLEVLEHLDSPIAAIRSIHNLLKPGGHFIGTSPYPYPKNVSADPTHTYVLHPTNWKKLFLDAGFQQVDTKPMSFVPVLWRLFPYLNFPIPIYLPFKNFISTSLITASK